MQQSIVKFIALSYRHCSTCFGHYYVHHQEPVRLSLQPLVSVWMWRWKVFSAVVSLLVTNRPRLRANGRFVSNKPTTTENTSTPAFIRKPKAATAVWRAPNDLMMGIVMPETCWAVSVRQSNKFYDWLLHPVWCFIWVLDHCYLSVSTEI